MEDARGLEGAPHLRGERAALRSPRARWKSRAASAGDGASAGSTSARRACRSASSKRPMPGSTRPNSFHSSSVAPVRIGICAVAPRWIAWRC
ncbi:MAG: hypothetical protein MZV64_35200 [Ignavibacteriales bacterium]|nr:hypothetical protein [Ignavibacteriales bacterium]